MVIDCIEENFEDLHKKLKKVNIVHGISTNVGKTYTTALLLRKLNLKFKENFAIKPVISGFDENDYQSSDNFYLLQASGIKEPTLKQVKEISKYLLSQPLSPDIAAKKQGIAIHFDEIITFCEANISQIKESERIFIEMAGGVCSPCSNSHTMADISNTLLHHSPCNILVTVPYLGSLSHTISALKVLKFDVVIVNKANSEAGEEFVWSLKNHLNHEIEIIESQPKVLDIPAPPLYFA